MFDRLQDDYADAMAPFGLRRGERHSGRKNEPPGQFVRRLARQQKQAEERERAADLAASLLAQEHAAVAAVREHLAREREVLDADQRALKWKGYEFAGEMLAERSTIERDRAGAAEQAARQQRQALQLAKFRDELLADAADLDAREAIIAAKEAELARERAQLEAQRIHDKRLTEAATAAIAHAEAERQRLTVIADAADRYQQIISKVRQQLVPPDFAAAFDAAKQLRDAAAPPSMIERNSTRGYPHQAADRPSYQHAGFGIQ